MLADQLLLFFGKPVCINNRKQKQILHDAGVEFNEINLLEYGWTTGLLSEFFAGLPKSEWVNKAAPDIKSGAVDFERLSNQALLQAMVANPILIRRPLLAWQGKKWVGFDWQQLCQELPVTTPASSDLVSADEDIESCPRSHAAEG